ncbi:MAG: beta-aspartyl-peptidase [Euryarchaeota archaeon]|nr:beta-aspartyl-peptidase [Euryarchaeota archaeon]
MAILVIHGGAGGDGPWLGKTPLDPGRIDCMKQVLQHVGSKLENNEIDCLEAVTLAVEMLEDEPLFNAGKGSVISGDGSITMDASIMRGIDKAAGSVINVKKLRHPIRAANLILHQGWPVIMNSDAADDFAIAKGVEEVSQDWLKTDLRKGQWQQWKDSKANPGATDEDDSVLDHDLESRVTTEFSDEGMGTVGAVALDNENNLAAATSTGGMTGKPSGRVGDTPIIGAGTWSDDKIAISCTGVGEAYIRTCAAHNLANKFQNSQDLDKASDQVLDEVAPLGGRGGLIAVTREGDYAMPFQTRLMYRGSWNSGSVEVGIGPELEK